MEEQRLKKKQEAEEKEKEAREGKKRKEKEEMKRKREEREERLKHTRCKPPAKKQKTAKDKGFPATPATSTNSHSQPQDQLNPPHCH